MNPFGKSTLRFQLEGARRPKACGPNGEWTLRVASRDGLTMRSSRLAREWATVSIGSRRRAWGGMKWIIDEDWREELE